MTNRVVLGVFAAVLALLLVAVLVLALLPAVLGPSDDDGSVGVSPSPTSGPPADQESPMTPDATDAATPDEADVRAAAERAQAYLRALAERDAVAACASLSGPGAALDEVAACQAGLGQALADPDTAGQFTAYEGVTVPPEAVTVQGDDALVDLSLLDVEPPEGSLLRGSAVALVRTDAGWRVAAG